jgi:type II secretory pathway pseudopilin PulG
MKPRARQHGAALLTMLLVAIVATAAVLLSAFSGSAVEQAREQRSYALLAQASEALIGFAATHGRLPRPARPGTAGHVEGGAGGDGRERPQPCATEADCSGVLPWLDLGLPAADTWGHQLHYSVTPAFTAAPLARTAAIATKRVLSRDANGALFFVAGQESCSLAAQCAPAVLFSRGRGDAPGSQDETGNLQASVDFMRRPRSTEAAAAGGAFDDLLVTVPLHVLYERMAAAKTLP